MEFVCDNHWDATIYGTTIFNVTKFLTITTHTYLAHYNQSCYYSPQRHCYQFEESQKSFARRA